MNFMYMYLIKMLSLVSTFLFPVHPAYTAIYYNVVLVMLIDIYNSIISLNKILSILMKRR